MKTRNKEERERRERETPSSLLFNRLGGGKKKKNLCSASPYQRGREITRARPRAGEGKRRKRNKGTFSRFLPPREKGKHPWAKEEGKGKREETARRSWF